jgi:hypothetical protein
LNQKSFYTNSSIDENLEIVMADSLIDYGDRQKILFTGKGLTPGANECFSEVSAAMQTGEIFCAPDISFTRFPDIDSIITSNDSTYFYSEVITFPIFFLQNANVGTKWNILNPSFANIFIECTEITEGSFLGVTDSIKIFEFYNEAGYTILESYQIVLSKNYGLIQFIDFNYYPAYSEALAPQLYILSGFESGESTHGFNLPEFHDYFSYAIGDVLYWERREYSYDPMNTYSYSTFYQDSVTEKEIFNDSILFYYDGVYKQVFYKNDFENLISSPSNWVGLSNSIYGNGYLGELGVDIWCSGDIHISINDDTVVERKFTLGSGLTYDECIIQFYWDVGWEFKLSSKAGITYRHYGIWWDNIDYTLIGYKINGEEFGITNITSIAQNSKEDISIFPSPSTAQIKINLPSIKAHTFKIYNINNLLILSGVLANNEIDVRDIKQGIYFLEIQNGNEILRGKFVKM